VIQKNTAQMTDQVAEMYSQPNLIRQSGGGIARRQLGGGPFDMLRRMAIPLLHGLRNRLGDVAGGMAKAIKEAGGAAIKKIAADAPVIASEGIRKLVEKGTEKLLEKRPVAPVTETAPKRRAAPKRRKAPKRSKSPTPKRKRNHKRSRIDDVLGSDTY